MSEAVRQAQSWLREIGFRVEGQVLAVDGKLGAMTRLATMYFQTGWTPSELLPDGEPGPVTMAALEQCAAWQGRASEHFRFSEFASRGNKDIRVDRRLILGLEEMRAVSGGPIVIISGYRDEEHNRKVGGAVSSQHLYGRAADIKFGGKPLSLAEVKALQQFSGIGYYPRRRNLVRHVDVRPTASASKPTTWTYGA